MLYPGMMDMEPEPLIPATARMYLRIVGFVVISTAIFFYGDMMDMPETLALV